MSESKVTYDVPDSFTFTNEEIAAYIARLEAIRLAAPAASQGTDSVAALEECRAGRMAELVDDYADAILLNAGHLGVIEV